MTSFPSKNVGQTPTPQELEQQKEFGDAVKRLKRNAMLRRVFAWLEANEDAAWGTLDQHGLDGTKLGFLIRCRGQTLLTFRVDRLFLFLQFRSSG